MISSKDLWFHESKGADLIREERLAQGYREQWTSAHDASHTRKELAAAGACYAFDYVNGPHVEPSSAWPWESEWWKPTPDDPVRQLVKAGALIAAEIDRLLRERGIGLGLDGGPPDVPDPLASTTLLLTGDISTAPIGPEAGV